MPEPLTMIGVGGGVMVLLMHLARRYFMMAKEVVDIILGSIACVFSLPLLLVCSVVIKLSSKGPILHRQVRVGKDGKLFTMFKLRTMYVDAESKTGPVWATDGDPRVIPACRWMRRCHADELPQLINVIKGQMSLVGPRPERPEILAELEKAYPLVRKRLAVRPGITGLAQVRNGYDTDIEAFRRKLDADLEYIGHPKWSKELQILAGTVTKLYDKGAH